MGEGKTAMKLVVAIVADGHTCDVVPTELLANVGDQVIYQNLTGNPIIIFFPNASLFGQSVIELGPGQEVTLTVGNVDFDSYGYTVYCEGKKDFVNKAARPRVIVFRKPA